MRQLCGLLTVVLAGTCGAAPNVDFARDVQPILRARCGACHSGDKPQAGLLALTREGLLKGGASGAAVKPGSSRDSLLIRRLTGGAPRMPLGGSPLAEAEIGILRDWVDAGAVWDGSGADVAPAATPLDTRIRPRRPAVPARGEANPIDAFVQAYWRRNGIGAPLPPAATDAVFLRRAAFDLIGLPSSPDELDRFLKDPDPGKRERLIDSLLGRREQYADHWMSFWNDLLRNEDGVALPGEKRAWITAWLQDALRANMPYDQMVRALLHPEGPKAPAAFLAGVNWGGDVSASQTPAMQAAQNSAQVFLGANLKCAGCHDSFVSRWKLAQTFGLAAFFAAEPLEIARCDVKTGARATPVFPFPEIAEEPAATLPLRRAQVARMFTSPANGRFARTIVNRYWRLLLGRGIIEPVDDLEAPAWDADLLDWLASDFVAHGHDLQFLLRRITTSRVYQSQTIRDGAPGLFRGPIQRRLTAEQFVDAVSAITGEWKIYDDRSGKPGPYSRHWRLRADPLTRALGRPDRSQVTTTRGEEATILQALELVNGDEFRTQLRRGARRLTGLYRTPARSVADSGHVREAASVEADITGAQRVWLIVSDFGSYDRASVKAGWGADAEFAGPQGSARLRDLPLPAGASMQVIQPKGGPPRDALLAARMVYDVAGKGYTRFRATVALDESGLRPETTAKIRFLVFTGEPDPEEMIRPVGESPVPRPEPGEGVALARRLFRAAVARDPAANELAEARNVLRKGPEGVEDLLWILFLSPEFQFLR